MNKKQKDIIKIIEAKTGKTMKEIVTELKKELIKRNAIKI